MVMLGPDTALDPAQLSAHFEGGEPPWRKLSLGRGVMNRLLRVAAVLDIIGVVSLGALRVDERRLVPTAHQGRPENRPWRSEDIEAWLAERRGQGRDDLPRRYLLRIAAPPSAYPQPHASHRRHGSSCPRVSPFAVRQPVRGQPGTLRAAFRRSSLAVVLLAVLGGRMELPAYGAGLPGRAPAPCSR